MTVFKRDEIIILLGAGASAEAGIPDSNEMVQSIEDLVTSDDPKWRNFRDLYRYIKASIFYADGLAGKFGGKVHYNVERLVNVLDELQQRERHTLYPFVGAWNAMLVDVAGPEFANVQGFRSAIIEILRKEWLALPMKETASYYSGLLRFQEEYEHPLRVFSLNYDLCIERVCSDKKVQRGFSGRTWDWRLFDETSDDPLPLLLYKLHGSMDWMFTEDNDVTYWDDPVSIADEKIAIIFGDSYKLQYIDPFLFLAYQLRRCSLEARLIVCVGYGFNDPHINGILKQSLRQDERRKLLAIVGPRKESNGTAEKSVPSQPDSEDAANWEKDSNGAAEKSVSEKLDVKVDQNIKEDQIIEKPKRASEFFESGLTISYLKELFPSDEDLFSELTDSDEATD